MKLKLYFRRVLKIFEKHAETIIVTLHDLNNLETCNAITTHFDLMGINCAIINCINFKEEYRKRCSTEQLLDWPF